MSSDILGHYRIFSDLHGHVLFDELEQVIVHINDRSIQKHPLLVLDNLTAIENCRNFLNEVIKKYGKKGGYDLG